MEISALICSANQWAGFYIIGFFVKKELIKVITILLAEYLLKILS